MNSTRKNKTLVVIGGPTASGKSSVAVQLALHYGSEVISADARQLFREMKIGTAVPDPYELKGIPHHFLQTVPLTENYNASRYEFEVLDLLEKLFDKHPVVFLAGGSGMYIDAVCKGIDDLPSFDPLIREHLAEKYRKEGLESIRNELKKLDPVSYEKIDTNNYMRVLKALEVTVQTGRPYSSFLTNQTKERPFGIIRIALDVDRDILYDRINKRVEEMMDKGLLKEAERLYPQRHLTALKTVGYKELFDYIDGKTSLKEAVDLIKRNTRKYARKQITWFRKDDAYKWLSPDDPEKIISWIDSCINA